MIAHIDDATQVLINNIQVHADSFPNKLGVEFGDLVGKSLGSHLICKFASTHAHRSGCTRNVGYLR